MSRSRQRTPISGWAACRSEKKDKQLWHRAYRRAVRVALAQGLEDLPHYREHSNPWMMGKDGKVYFGNSRNAEIYMRK